MSCMAPLPWQRITVPILAIRLLPMRCSRRKIGLPEQFSLFADKMSGPEGLRYAEEFVSPAVEKILIGHIAALPLQPFQFGQYEGKRRVASFGFRYDYTTRRLAFGGPGTRMGQVLCTEYDVGVGIGWHRDKPQLRPGVEPVEGLRVQVSVS
jgi:hypothetical protein